MNKKEIILSKGEAREMTYEDILEQFKHMLQGAVSSYELKFGLNSSERDDLLQELRIQVWQAYERYDGVHAFSTYLVPRLKLGVSNYRKGMNAKKRTNNGILSLNKELDSESDSTLENLLGVEDTEMLSFEFSQFLNFLEQKLPPHEMKILNCLINKQEFSVQDLAHEWGISRVAANNHVRKFREKLKVIMRSTGFVTC